MLARWVSSFAASCYIIGAIAVLPAWLAQWRVPPAEWWAVYLVAEAVIMGVLVSVALWWFLWRAGAGGKRYHPTRLLGLTAMTLLPVFGLLVVPIGCWVSVRGPAGTVAGWGIFALSALGFAAFWAYSRYAGR